MLGQSHRGLKITLKNGIVDTLQESIILRGKSKVPPRIENKINFLLLFWKIGDTLLYLMRIKACLLLLIIT